MVKVGDRVIWKGLRGFIADPPRSSVAHDSDLLLVVFDKPRDMFHDAMPEYPDRCFYLYGKQLELDNTEVLDEATCSITL